MKGDEMGGACSMHGRHENAYKILVWKPDGKILLKLISDK
jgi:hypothetical protein